MEAASNLSIVRAIEPPPATQTAPRRPKERSAVRYPLEVPVVFRWMERGQARESQGLSRDVSVRGAFVLSRECPPCGARVVVSMNFPATLRARAGWVEAEGLVVRVERQTCMRPAGFVVEGNGPRLFTR
jgi:hypothetical protein